MMETATDIQSKEVDLVLPLLPLPWQSEVEAAAQRFKVIVAGRRSGKTVLAVNQLIIHAATKENSTNWYVAPTYSMAKDIAWGMLKEFLSDFRSNDLIIRDNESYLSIYFANNSIIQLKGADKPDSLRGVGLDFLVIDEYATMKKEVWNEVLRPATSDKNAPVIFIGTPKGYNDFYDIYQHGFSSDPAVRKLWYSRHVKTSEAGTIPEFELAQAKRDMDERVYRQEYEAAFETFGGQVFLSFNRKEHMKDFKFKPELELDLGMDFGWASTNATLFIQVDAMDNVFVVDELNHKETKIADIAADIRAKAYKSTWEDIERKSYIGYQEHALKTKCDPNFIFCDPAGDSKNEALGTSSVAELKRAGFRVKYKDKYPGVIQDRVNLIRKWLNNSKLKIHPRCVNLIRAFEMYRYPDPKNNLQSELPLKDGISDHWIDSLGEFFLNRFPINPARIGVL